MNGLDFPIDGGVVRVRESITGNFYWRCEICDKSSLRSWAALNTAEAAVHHIRRMHREKVAA